LSDTDNNLIREVGSNGVINTITGTGSGAGSGQGVGGETLTLSGSTSTAYGSSVTFTVIFSNAGKIATGQVSLVDTANSSMTVASAGLSNNVASISVSTLSAGTHNLVVSFGGDSQNAAITSIPIALTITPLPVIANVTGLSLEYGQTIPTITGTLSGILPQDANNVTAVFTTTATAASPVNQYPISVTLVGASATDYTVALASGAGDVTIGKAPTVALTSSNLSPFSGVPVTLTVLVTSSTTGIPTGTVSFYDGTTLLNAAPIANGSATYVPSALAGGAHSITAVYGGDANFTTSTSSAVVETVGSSPDFTLTPTGAVTQTVIHGKVATYTFALQPQGGTFASQVTLSASGLPDGATAVFTPATVVSGGTSTTVSLAIQTPALNSTSTSSMSSPVRAPFLPISAALFLLPLLRNRRVRATFGRAPRTLFSAIFLLIAGAAILGLAGCGSGDHDPNSSQTYTITVTASAAGTTILQHTATVTLIVQ
jgi:uncharacterized repeat protein (TIGR01451 family)